MDSLTTLLTHAAQPSTWPASVWVLLASLLAYGLHLLAARPSFPANAPAVVDSWPIVGGLRWWTARGDFMLGHAAASKKGSYSFWFGKYPVVGLSGEAGRKVFFENRHMSLPHGYSVLFNAVVPDEPKPTAETLPFQEFFHRTLNRLMRKEQLAPLTPVLVADTAAMLDELEARPDKILDPFQEMYRLVYKLTMRSVGCTEMAEDEKTLRSTLKMFEGVADASTNASAVLFPWLPTPSKVWRTVSGARFYMMLNKIVEARKRDGVRREDALQYMMDRGHSMLEMVGFIFGGLFAGLINSGINAAYLPVFLSQDPKWYKAFQEQVDGVVEKHRDTKEETPEQVLGRLTFEQWEDEFTLVDVGLKETIRFTQRGCGFRQNKADTDLPIGDTGEVVPRGAFAVYHMDDVHHNPDFYPEPNRWDPGRFLRGEDKKHHNGFLGWGVSLHPCLGMRFAKMEMAVVTAMWVSRFDYELCDKHGRPTTLPPIDQVLNLNSHSAEKPKDPVYLKYRARR